jgi:hypothetical protein
MFKFYEEPVNLQRFEITKKTIETSFDDQKVKL